MDMKMFSRTEPPTAGSKLVFVVKKVCLKSRVGLVELLVDIDWEKAKGVQQNQTEETASDQINPYGDSQANRGLEGFLTRRQNIIPYQLQTCILANILAVAGKWSEKAIIFLKSLLDKQMSGLVEDVLMPDRIILIDIPLIGNFLCRGHMAKKIEAGHFRSLVLSSLDSTSTSSMPCTSSPLPSNGGEVPKQFLYLELQSDLFENVKVTQVTDPLNLFCTLSIFSKELEKLSKKMQLHYEGRSTLGPGRPWVSGSPCATRSADGTWQRSQVTHAVASNTGFVDVLHVDHGETQRVPASEVQHLHESFLRIPVFTYHCALDGVDGATQYKDQIDDLKSLMCGAVVAKFERYDAVKNIYDVRLFGVEAECINQYFIEESIVILNSSLAGKDYLAEAHITPSGTDDIENSFIPKVDLTDQFLGCSASPSANGRTDDDKSVDKKCYPSPLRKENANSVMHNGPSSAQIPGVEKKTISEQFLPVGSCVSVKVSCVESPAMFFCQILENRESLLLLMEDLQNYYDTSSPEKPASDFCVARHPVNHMWYRVRIMDCQSSMTDVIFIDYGQTFKVPVQDLRPIDPRFMCKAHAIQCCLQTPLHADNPSAATWTAGATEEFQKFIDAGDYSDGELKCTVKATTHSPQGFACSVVDIGTPLQSVCDLLTRLSVSPSAPPPEVNPLPRVPVDQSTLVDTGKPVAPSNAFKNATLADLPPKLLEQGSSCAVHVSHFMNPSRVFVQLQQDEEDMYAIVEKLNDPEGVFSGPVQFESLNVSDLISAEFPDDGAWYRAVVGKKLDNGSLTVEFIDFGNKATVPCGKTCYLDKESLAQPRFAIPCQFGEIGNNQEQWDHEAISAFKSNTVENPEKTYSCTFIKETLDLWDIVLEDQGIAVSQTLIHQTQPGSNSKQTDCTEGTSRYTKPDVVPNRLYPVFATCIVGPHFFWCQHENPEVLDKVSMLSEEAGRSGGQDPTWVETLSLGSPCLALFPDDNAWYRAQVIRRTGDAISVLFVDYGNEAEVNVSGVKAVPRFLFETAPQAFLCALEGFDESKGTWEESASDEFYELLVDKALGVTPLNVGDNLYTAIPQYTVRAAVGETLVNKAMENHWKGNGTNGDSSPANSPPLVSVSLLT